MGDYKTFVSSCNIAESRRRDELNHLYYGLARAYVQCAQYAQKLILDQRRAWFALNDEPDGPVARRPAADLSSLKEYLRGLQRAYRLRRGGRVWKLTGQLVAYVERGQTDDSIPQFAAPSLYFNSQWSDGLERWYNRSVHEREPSYSAVIELFHVQWLADGLSETHGGCLMRYCEDQKLGVVGDLLDTPESFVDDRLDELLLDPDEGLDASAKLCQLVRAEGLAWRQF